MPWTVERSGSAPGAIVVVLEGAVTGGDLREVTGAALSLGRQHQTMLFLVDARTAVVKAGTMDLFFLPAKRYEDEQVDRSARIAVVAPESEKDREAVRFYETACLNRGWRARICETFDDATAWLSA